MKHFLTNIIFLIPLALISYLSISQQDKINSIYAQQFKDYPPARETVEVSALPKNANIETPTIAESCTKNKRPCP